MPGFDCVDLDLLTAPVGDNQVGNDPRTDTSLSSPYLTLKDVRAATRANEKLLNGPPPETTEEASLYQSAETNLPKQWAQIREISEDILKEQAKDLEVASWLTEALVRDHDLPGLADGLLLMRDLIEKYWDEGLYPQEDEDGLETRIAPVIALNGLDGRPSPLLQALKRVPLTDGGDDDAFQLWQYDDALDIAQIADTQQQQDRLAGGGTSMSAVESALQRSSREFLRRNYEAAKVSRENFQAILEMIYTKSGDMPPGTLLTTALDKLITCYESKVPHLLVDEAEAVAGEGGETGAGGGGGGEGGLNSREDAFNSLLRIADYFDKREPQSMIGQSIREVVRRGRLPMLSLIEELLPDSDARTNFLIRSGIKIDISDNSGY
jgi:type VI secretion system protein ImpA